MNLPPRSVLIKAAAAAGLPQGCCYGCGATLQTEVPGGPGYVAPAKYQVGCRGPRKGPRALEARANHRFHADTPDHWF